MTTPHEIKLDSGLSDTVEEIQGERKAVRRCGDELPLVGDFDPYDEWLGISPEDRPVDYYQLLGVPRFTSRDTTLRGAFDQRMAYLKLKENGGRKDRATQLRSEISAAYAVLRETAGREEYDATLRRAAEPHPRGLSLLVSEQPSSKESRQAPPRKNSGESIVQFVPIMVGGLLAIPAAIAILYFGLGRDPFGLFPRKDEPAIAVESAPTPVPQKHHAPPPAAPRVPFNALQQGFAPLAEGSSQHASQALQPSPSTAEGAPQTGDPKPLAPAQTATPSAEGPIEIVATSNGFSCNGHEYVFFETPLKWSEAEAKCRAVGGHLAMVESKNEGEAILAFAANRNWPDFWLGATDNGNEGDWTWADGSKADLKLLRGYYDNLNGGEHYLCYYAYWKSYNDMADRPLPFLCEWNGPATVAADAWVAKVEALPPARTGRARWLYELGSFTLQRNGSWKQEAGGSEYRYRERVCTGDYVELESETASARVRLYDDRCEIAKPPTAAFAQYRSGRWELPIARPASPEPGVTGETARGFIFNGHEYVLFPLPMSWKGAAIKCRDMGGHLAIVETTAERDAILAVSATQGWYTYWLGGTDEGQEGQWSWVDGRRLDNGVLKATFDNWGGSENYLCYYSPARNWNDSADQVLLFLCEWEGLAPEFGIQIKEAGAAPVPKQAPPSGADRTCWQFDQGTIKRTYDGSWIQLTSAGHLKFREQNRTNAYVELENISLRLRLYDDRAEILRLPGSTFERYRTGKWVGPATGVLPFVVAPKPNNLTVKQDRSVQSARGKLDRAITAYEKLMALLQADFREHFDRVEATARKTGSKLLVDQAVAARREFEMRRYELPRSASDPLRKRFAAALSALDEAHTQVTKDLVAADCDEEARRVEWQLRYFKAGRPADGRCHWAHARGHFARSADGHWAEYFDGKYAYTFVETARHEEYIELYDAPRQCHVHLHGSTCWVKIGTGSYGRCYDGEWKKAQFDGTATLP